MSGRLLTSARDFVADAHEARFVLLPVLCCINLTKDLWISIYEAKKADKTGGLDWYLAIIVSTLSEKIFLWAIAATIYVYIFIAMLKKFCGCEVYAKRMFKSYCRLCFIVIVSFVISGTLIYDFTATLRLHPTTQLTIVVAATQAYGVGALLVFFVNCMPSSIYLLYVITNNALLATFVLSRSKHLNHTAPFGLHRMHLFAVVVGRSMTIGGVPMAYMITCGVLIELLLADTKDKRSVLSSLGWGSFPIVAFAIVDFLLDVRHTSASVTIPMAFLCWLCLTYLFEFVETFYH